MDKPDKEQVEPYLRAAKPPSGARRMKHYPVLLEPEPPRQAAPEPPTAPPEPKGKMSRREAWLAFCDELSGTCDSATTILRKHPEWGLPQTFSGLCRMKRSDPWMEEEYQRARDMQADYIADEMMDLAAQATDRNAHAIRVRIDTHKWIAAKLKPHRYGDKQEVQHSGEVKLSEKQIDERLAHLLGKEGAAGVVGGAGASSEQEPDSGFISGGWPAQ